MRAVTIKIKLTEDCTPEVWEKVEDKIADTLSRMGLKGGIHNSATGNSTQIRKETNGHKQI
jgi:hypothetical protein